MVVLTVGGAWPWTVVAYFGAAWAGHKMDNRHATREDYRPTGGSIHSMRTEMRDIDHRLAEIDRYVASPNNSLAREIDSLR